MTRRGAAAALALLALGVVVSSAPALTMDPANWPAPTRAVWTERWLPLALHMGTAIPALLLGPLQLLTRGRGHRWLGAAYAALATVGALSGLSLGLTAYGGPVARAGFVAMGAAWLACTWMGLQRHLEGRHAEHGRWMLRSYAVAFGAVTLRLQLLAIPLLGLPSEPVYAAAAWLGWLPNLAVAEALSRSAAPRPSPWSRS